MVSVFLSQFRKAKQDRDCYMSLVRRMSDQEKRALDEVLGFLPCPNLLKQRRVKALLVRQLGSLQPFQQLHSTSYITASLQAIDLPENPGQGTIIGGMFVGKPWSSSSCSEAEQPPKKSQVLKDVERNHYLLQRLWKMHWSRIAPRLPKKRPAGKPARKKTAADLHPTKAKTPKGKKDQKGTKDMSQAPGPAAASK